MVGAGLGELSAKAEKLLDQQLQSLAIGHKLFSQKSLS